MEATRQSFHKSSKEWEEREKVLGHCVRADITKPKELLSIPSIHDMEFDYDDDDDVDNNEGIEYKTPFSSRLWNIRVAVQRGFLSLYTVQELTQILSSPVITSNEISKGKKLSCELCYVMPQ